MTPVQLQLALSAIQIVAGLLRARELGEYLPPEVKAALDAERERLVAEFLRLANTPSEG